MSHTTRTARPAASEAARAEHARAEHARTQDVRTEDARARDARSTAARTKDGDDVAVASFVLGLVGLFFFNIVLGPLALALGGVSLRRGTRRRTRALLGLALGAADLVVLAVLMASQHGGFTWHPGI